MRIRVLDNQKLSPCPALRHLRLNQSIISAIKVRILVFFVQEGIIIDAVSHIVRLVVNQVIVLFFCRVIALDTVGPSADTKFGRDGSLEILCHRDRAVGSDGKPLLLCPRLIDIPGSKCLPVMIGAIVNLLILMLVQNLPGVKENTVRKCRPHLADIGFLIVWLCKGRELLP